MPKLFDYEEKDPKTEQAVRKQGLFSKLGTVLSYTAVGLKDPGQLAQIEAQNARAEQEYQMFQQRMDQQRMEAMMKMAESGFMNVNDVPAEQAMSTPDNPMQTVNIPKLGQFTRNQNMGMVIPEGMELYGIASNGKPMYRKSAEKISENKLLFQGKKDLQSQIPEVSDLFQAFNTVDKYAEELGDFKSGPSQLMSKANMKYKEITEDPKVSKYVGAVGQQLAKIARKQNDEKGALSDFDVERVLKGLGNKTAPLEVKKALVNEMRDAARKKILSRLDSAGITLEEFASEQPKAYQAIFGEKSVQTQSLSPDNLFEGL